MSTTVFILSIIISFIIGFIGSTSIKAIKKKNNPLEHSGPQEIKALMEIEYRKGVEEGEKKAFVKFTLIYEPFVDISDSLLKKTAEAGYTMQMFYNGLPLGDPMKRVTHHEEKYKDENMKYILDTINGTINNLMLVADPLGIPVTMNEKPKIEKKKAKTG
ncbi:hypothetical protein H70357_31105 [Paenibacillus sp. FSL H7-0357]|uniref:hypothetical protein n=1 Tax=Paenibacillus sp. FSL H7-0357 TaxID=1536774 RepID=UPI0004F8C914|nr:hypothetical protein [Paenibacillus sp. FSL H7-0357]AIQ20643.1 hypothetical protein H70357_31105 [Paenibacillus sp. FSL H7-0357]